MELEFRQWTLNKIEENPKLYGGDDGNPAIIRAYFSEMHAKTYAKDLTYGAISVSVGISRERNKILEKRKDLDFRIKYKPKQRKNK